MFSFFTDTSEFPVIPTYEQAVVNPEDGCPPPYDMLPPCYADVIKTKLKEAQPSTSTGYTSQETGYDPDTGCIQETCNTCDTENIHVNGNTQETGDTRNTGSIQETGYTQGIQNNEVIQSVTIDVCIHIWRNGNRNVWYKVCYWLKEASRRER